MQILSPEEIRKAEDKAAENGLSYEEMMESAGIGCAEHIIKNYPDCKNIVIICGKGKNGGDGFVIARHLYRSGKKVSVILAFNSPSDALSEKNKKRIDGYVDIIDGSTVTKHICRLLEEADITVDVVFGIGFKGKLPQNVISLFSQVKNSSAVKISVDVPSGLTCENEDTNGCFDADETLSMLCFKKEHILKPHRNKCGKISIIPIGFQCDSSVLQALTENEIYSRLPTRPFNSNKGTFGRSLIIAGSYKMPGAAVIATKASLSMGAGLTCLAFPDCIYNTVTAQLTECIFRPLSSDINGETADILSAFTEDELNGFSAIAIGPGLSSGEGPAKVLETVLKNYKGKLIIDADGINLISRNINLLKETESDVMMTPHPGEMARLTGKTVQEINASRQQCAKEFAEKYKVTLLLKGANTVIATPEGEVFINSTGCSALSRGGSGDLLTGMTVSLAAQGMSCKDAAVTGAYIHGRAGEIAEERYTSYCATVDRIYGCIPTALSEILSGK